MQGKLQITLCRRENYVGKKYSREFGFTLHILPSVRFKGWNRGWLYIQIEIPWIETKNQVTSYQLKITLVRFYNLDMLEFSSLNYNTRGCIYGGFES